MNKSNQSIASQYMTLTYFTLSLAMCTLCMNFSVSPFKQVAENIKLVACNLSSANPFTEEGNALYVHLLQ